MNSNYKMVICIALILTMVACSSRPSLPKNETPDIGIPKEVMNTVFQVSAPKALNTFNIGDEVTLEVKVVSSEQVAFERDMGARMFIFDANQWIEVQNSVSYDYLEPKDYVFVPYADNPFNLGMAVIEPVLQNTSKAMTVRIFLVGSIYQDGRKTNEKAAAYVDVNLRP